MTKFNKKIIGVDFDGTLSKTINYPTPGEPIQEVIDYLLDQQRKGAKLILITMREGIFLKYAIDWCKEQGLEFDAINDNLDYMKEFFQNNPRKIFVNEYIDDMNIGGIDFILQEIRRKINE